MGLYDELKSHFDTDRYQYSWKEYRNQVTDLLINETAEENISFPIMPEFNPGESTLLIAGAGSCSDLDLTRIREHFSHITLLDINQDSMNRGLKRYGITQEDSQFDTVCGTLTGITESDEEYFTRQLERLVAASGDSLSPDHFATESLKLLDEILSRMHTDPDRLEELLPKEGYDHVFISGVHSQLLAMLSYINRAFCVNLTESERIYGLFSEDKIASKLQEANENFIPILDQALVNCARKRLIAGFEWDVINPGKKDQSGSRPSYPVEGAYQGVLYMKEICGSMGLNIQEHHIRWPFDPVNKKSYDMCFLCVGEPGID